MCVHARYCDDNNNNCACAWDGGDCCGHDNNYANCEAFAKTGDHEACCLDAEAAPAEEGCSGICSVHAFKGDGFCDDQNNICGCGWDGGDCCGETRDIRFCEMCACRDPADTTCSGDFAGPGTCEVGAYSGDGYCDDGNNNCGCGWDGGDCCTPPVSPLYCDHCACLDPAVVADTSIFCSGGRTCGASGGSGLPWVGDGFCDDENNNCGCGWDGGDCCGDNVSHLYCEECVCLDAVR
jgi:hypothetical protein